MHRKTADKLNFFFRAQILNKPLKKLQQQVFGLT